MYADTTDDGETSSGEQVVEAVEVIEPGNTSNDINSSTNLNDTNSGNNITEDSNSNTTIEQVDEAESNESIETSLDLDTANEESEEDDSKTDISGGFRISAILRESKISWPFWDDECEHTDLDSDDVEYHLNNDSDDTHYLAMRCKDCGEYILTDTTEPCEFKDSYVKTEKSKHMLKHTCEKCGKEIKEEAEECTSANPTFTKSNDTHHIESGVCDVCGKKYTKSETECEFIGIEGNTNLKYCSHSEEGCINVQDSRKETPEIKVNTVVNADKTSPKDIQKYTQDGKEITAFNKQITITATVTAEKLNDESFEDIKNANALTAKLELDGEDDQMMELKSFNDGVAVFTWTSKEMYDNAVSVDGLTVNYSIAQKLKDGSRDKEKVKSGEAEEELNYILRNIDTDKAVKNIKGSVSDGAGWSPKEGNPWYSKNVEGHKDELILTWEGQTDAPIDVDTVKLAELGNNSTSGIKLVSAVSDEEWTLLDRIKSFFKPHKVKYNNKIVYTVPAEDNGIDGVKHTYELSFEMLNKEHTKTLETYIDNQAPKYEAPEYTSKAEKLHGKFYKDAVNASVHFSDEHLSKTSVISAGNVSATDKEASGNLSINIEADGEYTLKGELKDLAGNITVFEDTKNTFVIDKKAPTIEEIKYISKSDRKNGKYFNEDVNIEVSVSDDYLSSEDSYIEVSEDNNVNLSEDAKTSDTLKLLVSDEGEYILKGKIYDLAGNYTDINDKAGEFIIDKTAPKIDVKFDNNSFKNGKYFNASRTADIKIKETYFTEKGVEISKSESSYADVPSHKGFTQSDDINATKIEFAADGHYGFTIKVTDLAGNVSETFKVDDFVIDTISPEIKVNFDNHNVKHEKYYKEDRTATFELTDLNIDGKEADMSKVVFTSKTGKATVNGMTGADGKYTGTIQFNQDGIYKIEDLKFEDKAGNLCKLIDGSDANYNAEFVIDKTVPVIEVEFDNNSAMNQIFYKAKRTAEITFTEVNFTADQVFIKKSGSDQDPVPGFTAFTEKNDKNITKINYDKDGRFGFELYTEDLAGNISQTYVVDTFVIDTTAPELEISGVEDMSANNGSVVPFIKSRDVNINDMSTEITLTGSNNGVVKPNITKTTSTEIFTYTLADLAHEKKNDDLYTLSVKLTDFAGNEVEKKVQYSINRFGSIFVLSDATKAMIDGYYVTKPQDVVITEINVDALTKKEVSVAFDGSVKELREGGSFTTSDSTNSNGWHSISYTVGKSNFNKDGIYSVNVYSEDKASNRQSSQSKEAELEFLLDKTAPSVIVSGMEEGGIYEEDSHDFSINAADTIGVKTMTVYLNDEKLESYSASELSENGGTVVLTVPSKDDYQKVTIECSDVAGNETKLAYNNLLVSVKAEELLLEDNLTPTSNLADVADSLDSVISNSSKTLVILIVIFAMAICGGAGAYAFKKKKK